MLAALDAVLLMPHAASTSAGCQMTSSSCLASYMQAKQDFNQVKDIAGQAGRKFSNLAQNFIKDLQGGY